MSQIETRIVSDIGQCEVLWRKFSPKKSIYDVWEFRIEFWNSYQFEPHFIVLSDNGADVGLLPLWLVPDQKSYFWFGDSGDGSNWQEDNDFWVIDRKYLKPLFEALPESVTLNNFSAECFHKASEDIQFQTHNPKNVLPVHSFSSVQDYLMTLNKKLRGNLVRDKRAVESWNPKMIIDQFSDFDILINMNIARHDDSMLKDGRVVNIFKDLITAGLKNEAFSVRMLSVYIDNKPAGFDFILIYNGIYYPLLCASDISQFSGIGNYMNLYDIQDAISLGMKMIDFAEGDVDCYKNRLFPMKEQYKIVMNKH